MVRLLHLDDLEHREKIRELIAEHRECAPSSIPDWFELDDHDYSDLLMELKARESGVDPDADDHRD